ncbi:hypothetical protein [Micromonospora sp. NPDC049107]|uniref:hypothetical protein n=1 Tax=unclassified Micromonospora TaxID=2617518 RepID=UPI0033F58636
MKPLRIQEVDGSLSVVQTPVTTFIHTESGRQVVVVSTAHFGERTYFQQIVDDVTDYEQREFEVYLEGTEHDPAVGAPTAGEQAILTEMKRLRDVEQRRMTTALGWVSQREELRRPSWKASDLTDPDILRAAGADAMTYFLRRRRQMLDWPDERPWRDNSMRVVFAASNRMLARGVGTRRPHRNPQVEAFDRVLLDAREAVVVAAALATKRPAVLVWGAAHRFGIATALAEHGYYPQGDPRWHTVGHLPSMPISLAKRFLRRPPRPHPQFHPLRQLASADTTHRPTHAPS